jgi:hypothetical protein
MDFDAKGQLEKKNGNTMKQRISYLYTLRKLMIQLGGEVLYNILIESGIPMKLVRLIKRCVN